MGNEYYEDFQPMNRLRPQDSAPLAARPRDSFGFFMRLLPFVTVSLVTVALFSYLNSANPDLVKSVLLKVDILGISAPAQAEKARIAAINALGIPWEQREVLINRTVFLGANEQMVQLALGEPRAVSARSDGARQLTVWAYYLQDDLRPTLLEFESGKLIGARKGSQLDVAQ